MRCVSVQKTRNVASQHSSPRTFGGKLCCDACTGVQASWSISADTASTGRLRVGARYSYTVNGEGYLGVNQRTPRSSKQVITYNILNNHLPNLLAHPSINPKSLQGCFTPTKQLHSHKKGSPVLFTLHNFHNNSNSGQLWDSSGIFRNLSYSTCSFTNLLHQESEFVAPLRC